MRFLALTWAIALALVAAPQGTPAAVLDRLKNITSQAKPMHIQDVNIVGGQPANPDQFPHQIAIMFPPNSNQVCCGGSLIARQWVLTAAHCSVCFGAGTVIKAGMLNRITGQHDRSVQTFNVGKGDFYSHPSYSGAPNYWNDIALVKLDHLAELNEHVQIISLYRGGDQELEPSTLRASGWGNLQSNGQAPAVLQYVDIPVINENTCKQTFPSVGGNQVCAGSNGHAICQGDSGGPLITTDSQYPYLVGISSYVIEDHCETPPNVFTRVSHYIDWIKAGTPTPIYLNGTSLLLDAGDNIHLGSPVKLNSNPGVPGSNQVWTFNGDSSITIPSSTGTLLCLNSAYHNPKLPKNQVMLWHCDSTDPNQAWKWDTSTGSIYQPNGWCLDAAVNGYGIGVQLAVTQCDTKNLGQRFWPTPVPPATTAEGKTSPLYAAGTSMLLDAGGTINMGTPVKLKINPGAPHSNQVWTFNGDSSITIPSSTGTLLCLNSAYQHPRLPKNQVMLWNCDSTDPNQFWNWDTNTGTIQNTGSGWCLDAAVNGFAVGVQLAVTSCSTNNLGQRFLPAPVLPASPAQGKPTPLYAFGTSLLLDAWVFGGKPDIRVGSPVKLNSNPGAPVSSQMWTFNNDGSITTPSSTGTLLCLNSAYQHPRLPKNQVMLWNCDSTDLNQQWKWDTSTGTIVNTPFGWCLDAAVNGYGKGVQLAVTQCDPNNLGQRFNTNNIDFPF